MKYIPPTPEDMQRLKDELNLTGAQMAEFVNISGGQQWRKYTGGKNPRKMNFHMLYYLASKLVLDDAQIEKVFEQMEGLGASIND